MSNLVYYGISENGEAITAASIPDLDDWGYDDWWNCEDWITWHKLVKRAHGQDYANQIFMDYWNQQTFGAGALDCRTFNNKFRSYVKKNGMFEAVYEEAGFLKYILLPTGTAGDIVTETTGGISTGAKILKYAIPAGLLGLAIWGGVTIYKEVKK